MRHLHAVISVADQPSHDCLIYMLNCYDVWSGPSRSAGQCVEFDPRRSADRAK